MEIDAAVTPPVQVSTTMSAPSQCLLSLPDESWLATASYLTAPEILSVSCTCRQLNQKSLVELFWKRLYEEQFEAIVPLRGNPREAFLVQSSAQILHEESTKAPKEDKLGATTRQQTREQARSGKLAGTVRWIPLQSTDSSPSDREGHNCVLLGRDLLVVGGFVTDNNQIYVKNLDTATHEYALVRPICIPATPGEKEVMVSYSTYGSSLTVLDSSRAVRFGGFRSGGYSNETSQVCVLKYNSDSHQATWQVQKCKLHSSGKDASTSAQFQNCLARAYHTSTLLFGRYLLVTGGMQSHTSIWSPIVLDTLTWTWLDDMDWFSRIGRNAMEERHGHSVIWDQARSRLLLAGGGTGSDLLRSGQDNSQVWEYRGLSESMFEKDATVEQSLVELRQWRLVHTDQHLGAKKRSEDEHDEDSNAVDPNKLSPSEAMTLGRCHMAFKISRDNVLFVFGSGRPSTNLSMGYNLATDTFFRPNFTGTIPAARFTYAGAYIPEEGYIFVHGGYNSHNHTTLESSMILDIAPGMNRKFGGVFPLQREPPQRLWVDDDDIVQRRGYQHGPGAFLMNYLLARYQDIDDMEE